MFLTKQNRRTTINKKKKKEKNHHITEKYIHKKEQIGWEREQKNERIV